MWRELREERLDVVLARAPDPKHVGHYIRVVNGLNPEWYRELCSRYSTRRTNRRKRLGKKHHDTRIRRERIVYALKTLADGRGARSWYADDLLRIAAEITDAWEEEARDAGYADPAAETFAVEADVF